MTCPEVTRAWYDSSQVLVFLSVRDENALDGLRLTLWAAGYVHVPFREPDLGGALTAVAAGPGAEALLSNLPLALREEVTAK